MDKWNIKTSMPFVIKQGMHQGGILSLLHYKLFNNDLLLFFQKMCVKISQRPLIRCHTGGYYINWTI